MKFYLINKHEKNPIWPTSINMNNKLPKQCIAMINYRYKGPFTIINIITSVKPYAWGRGRGGGGGGGDVNSHCKLSTKRKCFI